MKKRVKRMKTNAGNGTKKLNIGSGFVRTTDDEALSIDFDVPAYQLISY